MSRNKIIVIILVVIGAGFLGYRFFGNGGANGPEGGALPVSVAPVEKRKVVEWDEFSGRLVAVDRVEIRPRVTGTIEEVHFKEGDMVQKGQLLFTIDPRSFEAEAQRAEGMLAAAKSQSTFAEVERSRAAKILKDKAISQREFDSRQNDARVAKANLEAADAAYNQAKLNLEYSHITAPFAGKVSRAEVTIGNLVDAGPNAPILTTIVSSDPIYADFEIDEQSFIRYIQASGPDLSQLGNVPVQMGLAGQKDTPFKGVVRSFDNQLDTRSGTLRVRAVFDNPNGMLVPGLYAHVRLGGTGKQEALLITDKAVGTDQDKKFVLLLDAENKLEYRVVQLGAIVEGLRVVKEGLAEGDRIVVNGLQRVRPGMEVTPQLVTMDNPAPAPAPEQPAEGQPEH